MAYSPLARARLQAYHNETPAERAARHDRERVRREQVRQERREQSRVDRRAARKLEKWYRERGRE